MAIKSLLKLIKSSHEEPESLGIPGTEEFHAILAKERARSDRNGHGFSVVSFALSDSSAVARLDNLLAILNDHIRATDDIGWFDENSVGVLLYNTPFAGAWEFINNARGLIDQLRISYSCDVFTYPKDWTKISAEHSYTQTSPDHPAREEGLIANGSCY